jgi:hypothetical protein
LSVALVARIPLFIVSLPLTWLAGGLSIAFLWVAAPPVIWFLQAMAFNALFESERTRRLALSLARKPSGPGPAPFADPGAIGVADATTAELQPVLSRGTPLALFVLHGVLWLAPVIVNVVLLGSYLQFVRPNAANASVFNSRFGQEADALVGIGGWGWIKPLAPSLQDNLGHLATQAKNKESADKYEVLRDQIPYVFFPLQTWLYIAGILFGLDVSIRALQIESGVDPPAGLTMLLAASRNWLKGRREGKG